MRILLFFSGQGAKPGYEAGGTKEYIYVRTRARTGKCVFKRMAAIYWPGLCGGQLTPPLVFSKLYLSGKDSFCQGPQPNNRCGPV